MDDLRSIIREVLAEELRSLKVASGGGLRETISLLGDHELNAFAQQIAQLAADPAKRDAILSGRHVFTLSGVPTAPSHHWAQTPMRTSASLPPMAASAPVSAAAVARQQFSKNLLTEKDVEALPHGTRVISVGKSVRFTPLARDELRRLNIKIERAAA